MNRFLYPFAFLASFSIAVGFKYLLTYYLKINKILFLNFLCLEVTLKYITWEALTLSHDHKGDWCRQRGKIENEIFVIDQQFLKFAGLRIFIKLTELIKINFIRRLENFEADWIWLSFQNLKSFGNSSKISKFKFLAIFSRCRKWCLTWRHPSRIIKNRVSRHPSTCVKFIILEANSRNQMWWMDGLKTRRILDGPWIPDIPRHMSSYCLVLTQVDGLFDENRSMNEEIVLGRSLSHNTVHFPCRPPVFRSRNLRTPAIHRKKTKKGRPLSP